MDSKQCNELNQFKIDSESVFYHHKLVEVHIFVFKPFIRFMSLPSQSKPIATQITPHKA